MTENHKGNILAAKYYLTKGILQNTVFFDPPVAIIISVIQGMDWHPVLSHMVPLLKTLKETIFLQFKVKLRRTVNFVSPEGPIANFS